MSLDVQTQPTSLVRGDDGVIRVGGTRVPLDTIIESYNQGAAPEEIVQQYPAVALEHVYSAIAFYLHNQSEVDGYLAEGQRQEEAARKMCRDRFDATGLRQRLLARRENPRR